MENGYRKLSRADNAMMGLIDHQTGMLPRVQDANEAGYQPAQKGG